MHLHAFLWLFSLVSALPALVTENDKRSPAVTQFYFGVDSATHQAKFDLYSAHGYRIVSLSSYGSPSAALYAASWIRRPGTPYVAIHGANSSTYQNWFNQSVASGYVPTIVAVTGPRDSAVFSGVMEENATSAWTQYCDMTPDDIARNMQATRAVGQSMKSFREYGTPEDRRYCAIWHANPNLDHTDWLGTPVSSSDYQTEFDIITSKPYYRPLQISVAEDQTYTAVFTDNSVRQWTSRHGLTATELQVQQAIQKAIGRYVIHVSGGGSGSSARYAVVFAAQDIPSLRTWRVTGPAVTGWVDNSNVSASTEQLVKTFMQTTGTRQVQLSISRSGTPLLDRAYTWSEPERHTTQIQDPFLLASLSKMFNEAVVQRLYDEGKLAPNTTVYPLLGYSNPIDNRTMNVTVQQLLDHYGGYDRDISGDPTYDMRTIALAQSNGTRPASMKDVVDYMFARPLDHNPGEVYAYSNYGYLLLSYLVEHVTHIPYYNYLQTTILGPENLIVKPWLTSPAFHIADNVIQESDNIGLSALQPLNPYPVADIYGGDGQYKESALGCASLAANAKSLAKFAYTHAVWGNGGRAPGYAREGSTPGAQTWVESRWDNLDWALTVNTRDFPDGTGSFDNITSAIDSYLWQVPQVL